MTALYFFGRVNRFSLSAEGRIVGAIEMRDAHRAISLVRNKELALRALDVALVD
jgi:hypothetical protein